MGGDDGVSAPDVVTCIWHGLQGHRYKAGSTGEKCLPVSVYKDTTQPPPHPPGHKDLIKNYVPRKRCLPLPCRVVISQRK